MGAKLSFYVRCCFGKVEHQTRKLTKRRGEDRNSLLLNAGDFSFEAQKLSEAIARGVTEEVQSLLLESTTISINERDSHGFTALSRAAEYGRFEIFNLLLQLGANANEMNHDGTCAVHIAAQYGRSEIINLLGKQGADMSPNCVVTIESSNDYELTPMHLALSGFHIETVQSLLECGTNVYAHLSYHGEALFVPYLYFAAWLGFTDAMDLLLASQTNEIMQALDSNQFLGSTVLMTLCEFNHLEAVHYIFDEVMYSREDRVLLTNQKNANRCDWTALHYASWEAHSNMVKTLVECGANVDIADAFGRTPLHYACLRGNLSIISALIELGADTNKRDLGIAKLGDKPGNGKTAFESIPNSQNYQRITKAFKDSQAKFAQIRHQQRSLKLSSAMSKSKKSSHDQDGVQATSNASSGSTTPSRSSAYTNVQENGAYIQRLRAMQQE